MCLLGIYEYDPPTEEEVSDGNNVGEEEEERGGSADVIGSSPISTSDVASLSRSGSGIVVCRSTTFVKKVRA